MNESRVCFNCFVSPITLTLKFLGIDVMDTCEINFSQSKLYKAYKCFVMISAWIAVAWSIHISVIDKNSCIQRCGGFLYFIPDNKFTINVSKVFNIGITLAAAGSITGAFFFKKVKIEYSQENFEGEIAYLTKIKYRVYQIILCICISGSVLITSAVTIHVKTIQMPKNYYKFIMCQILYEIMIFWVLLSLTNIAAFIALFILFLRRRFKNIYIHIKDCKKYPDSMNAVLHSEELKHAELCEIIETFDNTFGNGLTIIVLWCLLFEACCFYYGIFGRTVERILLISLGLLATIVTVSECLIFAEIQDYAVIPIHELYIFNLYPMKIEDLIKVITFMKRINRGEFGLYYFGTVLYSRKFALEMLNSMWSYLSTLKKFKQLSEESYPSAICNQTINMIDAIT